MPVPKSKYDRSDRPGGANRFMSRADFLDRARTESVRKALAEIQLAGKIASSSHLEMAEASLRDELARIEELSEGSNDADRVFAALCAGGWLSVRTIEQLSGLDPIAVAAELTKLEADHGCDRQTFDGEAHWRIRNPEVAR